ncbi:Scr1 family TA system antitoxin-like transcriptional regulator [Actinoplanes rectilineatus]|uniref:Scr1 family TA system antitoxin-like transcriptional regulator n=1 Tax=Actinoplanes rectilineatus TaxID=113571 RepID=UPI0005F2AAAC|nr:Scr1 family TA system antitoxin-like transcriptional regulator [Actinoplanes rectilineatus]
MNLTPRQQFGRHLRQIREAAGITQSKQLAEITGIDPGLASRYELGQRWMQPEHARAWAAATGLTEAETDELLQELADTRTEDKRLRSGAQYGPKGTQTDRSRLFRAATRIRAFAIAELPYFLQTADYARQGLAGDPDTDAVIEMRQADGLTVGAPGKYFEIVIAESALRFLPCDPNAMRAQLSRLQGLVGLPGVEFAVLPFGVKLGALPKNAFTVYDETVMVDATTGELALTPKMAPHYTELMDSLLVDTVRGEDVHTILLAARNALNAA